jgi:hypothetical protein
MFGLPDLLQKRGTPRPYISMFKEEIPDRHGLGFSFAMDFV